ncbi:hypothetical protein FOXG_18986 [Fusarium oxysporum f. sp. lycopersici 4287]|uniref:Amine oxidase domain-containing protein n=1 Tax=Fusarium oxysporum f. sp. lycopersici (strain 4287 / CBS 123668 / FGSC 9935 / NRRL 34936) TaxID=426428 RepID=A0A0J9UUI0_FUSO4|nr:hypothetical protein FOXG_18986 [Fusarium oxysporum f. sp. lycopersici 4287]KNB02081.1 hypothetical protein FOXG_18986 [Fusarium oxysporum f. sp. lycopersici 4287]
MRYSLFHPDLSHLHPRFLLNPAARHTSKIYQDLWSTRPHTRVGYDQDKILRKFVTMDSLKQRWRGDLTSKPHIGVVGAGLAGLRCADILIQNGFKVTIIEARNRVGGRLHQEVLPNGHLADVGPNWIHGTNDNPMLDLAKQTNTAISDWESTSCVFNESGELLSLKDGEKYSTIVWDIIQDAFKHSNSNSSDIDSKESLHDFFAQKVTERVPDTEADHERIRSIVYINFPKPYWLGKEGDDRKAEGFVQWLSPNYVPDLNPRRWNQEVVELASLDPEVSHPTLLFYTYGEQSQYITSELLKISDPQKKDEFLLNFFKPYYSRLPHYSESNPDCKPSGFMATDWLHDELSGFGSYSNFQVGLEEGDADIRTMREGLPDHGLWLAGEHTAPFVGLGTATGAYWSGEAVGKRIAEAYYGRSK